MNATNSKTFTILYLLLVALLFSYGARGCQLTAARLAMSLGRDGGLPFARHFQYIVRGQPVVGLVLAAVAAALFGKSDRESVCSAVMRRKTAHAAHLLVGLVQFGSTNAFSSLLGTAVILLQISYGKMLSHAFLLCWAMLNSSLPDLFTVVPVVLMLHSGRAFLNKTHPDRKYNLGRVFGITCNLVSIFFVLQSVVVYCFPYTMVCRLRLTAQVVGLRLSSL